MKKVLVIGAIAALMLLASGCDAFRKMAGRPTSEDIELKRDLVEAAQLAQQLAEKARQDSIEASRKHIADSLAANQAMIDSGLPVKTAKQVSAAAKARMGHRYRIIIGAFANADNARRMQKQAEESGVEAELIPYISGITAVGVGPSDDLASLYGPYTLIKDQPFFPKAAWIMDIE